jgi:hypothetical protein
MIDAASLETASAPIASTIDHADNARGDPGRSGQGMSDA